MFYFYLELYLLSICPQTHIIVHMHSSTCVSLVLSCVVLCCFVCVCAVHTYFVLLIIVIVATACHLCFPHSTSITYFHSSRAIPLQIYQQLKERVKKYQEQNIS